MQIKIDGFWCVVEQVGPCGWRARRPGQGEGYGPLRLVREAEPARRPALGRGDLLGWLSIGSSAAPAAGRAGRRMSGKAILMQRPLWGWPLARWRGPISLALHRRPSPT